MRTMTGVTSYDRLSHVLVKICPASVICGSLGGKGFWGGTDTCVCMAESLSSSPETITMLLINYTSIQIKSLFKKKENIPNLYLGTCIYSKTKTKSAQGVKL